MFLSERELDGHRNIVRSSLDNSTAISVASALISSRLDQLNSLYCMTFHLSTQLAFNESSVQ